jgi:hypothetical protein
LVIVLLIVAVIAVVVSRFMGREGEGPTEAVVSEELVRWEAVEDQPLGHFVTAYHFGDDGYDTSFNIETPEPESEFYGACGED